jgi:hypothetical protein
MLSAGSADLNGDQEADEEHCATKHEKSGLHSQTLGRLCARKGEDG